MGEVLQFRCQRVENSKTLDGQGFPLSLDRQGFPPLFLVLGGSWGNLKGECNSQCNQKNGKTLIADGRERKMEIDFSFLGIGIATRQGGDPAHLPQDPPSGTAKGGGDENNSNHSIPEK